MSPNRLKACFGHTSGSHFFCGGVEGPEKEETQHIVCKSGLLHRFLSWIVHQKKKVPNAKKQAEAQEVSFGREPKHDSWGLHSRVPILCCVSVKVVMNIASMMSCGPANCEHQEKVGGDVVWTDRQTQLHGKRVTRVTFQSQLRKKCRSLLEINCSQGETALCCAVLALSGTDTLVSLIPKPAPGHQRLDDRRSPLSASQHKKKEKKLLSSVQKNVNLAAN